MAGLRVRVAAVDRFCFAVVFDGSPHPVAGVAQDGKD